MIVRVTGSRGREFTLPQPDCRPFIPPHNLTRCFYKECDWNIFEIMFRSPFYLIVYLNFLIHGKIRIKDDIFKCMANCMHDIAFLLCWVIGISGSLIWSKTLVELIFNPCGEFRWSSEGPVSQIHSPHLLVGAPGIFSDLLRFVQMLKRESGAESNGKLPHLFIPSKTAS